MSFYEIMRELERGVLLQALMENNANLSQTARHLAIHRNILSRRCKACDISVDQVKKNLRSADIVAERKANGM